MLCAGVAQLVEQLICNQQVGGSNPSTSSTFFKLNMEEYPSGQRGQTVNLLASPSVVRIHPPPPENGCSCQGTLVFYFLLRYLSRIPIDIPPFACKIKRMFDYAVYFTTRGPQSQGTTACFFSRVFSNDPKKRTPPGDGVARPRLKSQILQRIYTLPVDCAPARGVY